MKRKIITIDETKCVGCGQCIPDCPEGALQLIDGKARLVSDLFCDGLGACIKSCPVDAIRVEERDADQYDERRVMENIVKGGANVITAHLKHLKDHNQTEYFNQALEYLKEHNMHPSQFFGKGGAMDQKHAHGNDSGMCPGSRMMDLRCAHNEPEDAGAQAVKKSELRNWPIQLELINPNAPYFKDADLLIAADCVPFAYIDFHKRFLKGRTLIMFCPKLDPDLDRYVEKLAEIFTNQSIKSITLVHMEVPCCFGVEAIVKKALEKAGKVITIKEYTISLQGELV